MRQNRALRVLRGALAASVATFVALLSHVAAGGGMPAIAGVAVPWVFSVLVCTLLAGRSLSLTRLALAVGVSQVFFHVLFVLGFVTQDAAALGHVHGAVSLAGTDVAIVRVVADGGMWAWHVVAAVITTAFLHRGEATARGLAAGARHLLAWAGRLFAHVIAVFGVQDAPALPVRAAPRRTRRAPALAPLRRRGPPLFA